jgi:hypothetical protein
MSTKRDVVEPGEAAAKSHALLRLREMGLPGVADKLEEMDAEIERLTHELSEARQGTSEGERCVCGHDRADHETALLDGSGMECYGDGCNCETFHPQARDSERDDGE